MLGSILRIVGVTPGLFTSTITVVATVSVMGSTGTSISSGEGRVVRVIHVFRSAHTRMGVNMYGYRMLHCALRGGVVDRDCHVLRWGWISDRTLVLVLVLVRFL